MNYSFLGKFFEIKDKYVNDSSSNWKRTAMLKNWIFELFSSTLEIFAVRYFFSPCSRLGIVGAEWPLIDLMENSSFQLFFILRPLILFLSRCFVRCPFDIYKVSVSRSAHTQKADPFIPEYEFSAVRGLFHKIDLSPITVFFHPREIFSIIEWKRQRLWNFSGAKAVSSNPKQFQTNRCGNWSQSTLPHTRTSTRLNFSLKY